MDDRDPAALLVAATAAGDESAWHEIVDGHAAAPTRHRELLRVLMAHPPVSRVCDHARERWEA